LENEIEFRIEIENKYYSVMDQLQGRLGQLNQNTENSQLNIRSQQPSETLQRSRPLTASISFVPFQEEESFKNFIRRLEVFLHLHGQTMQPKDHVYTLLHALTPQLHQKLYDLCAPESPLDKTYSELVKILTEYVDPQPSTWTLQHRLLSRMQESQETIKIYSVELQKLTSDCDFNCEHCNKYIANIHYFACSLLED